MYKYSYFQLIALQYSLGARDLWEKPPALRQWAWCYVSSRLQSSHSTCW